MNFYTLFDARIKSEHEQEGETMVHFWFIIATSCIILELINPGLFLFLPISFAALATCIALWYDIVPCDQYLFFSVVCAISFLIVQQWLKKRYHSSIDHHYTSNAQALIGKTIVITQILEHNIGYGKVNGEIWQAELNKPEALVIGQAYVIVAVQGIRLLITPILQHP